MIDLLKKILQPKPARKLLQAIATEKNDLTKELLENGYSANAIDETGQHVLFSVMANNTNTRLAIVELLLAYGADVNCRRADGCTPVFLARGEVLQLLLANQANVIVKNNQGATPLHFATDVEEAKVLVDLGLNINERDNEHNSILHNSMYGSYELVKYCLESGADVHAQNQKGWTPLTSLARTEKVMEQDKLADIIAKAELLLEAGADINVLDYRKWTISDHAIFVNNNPFAIWLRTMQRPYGARTLHKGKSLERWTSATGSYNNRLPGNDGLCME
ncbi:Ankyrin repeat [Filimonas lacunae]|uniref:Ankyrin repeat n=1 Tax=Filimonas lacunae TaxID=477680 RepID=A0A173MF44_9BACT|nr:ankyrin repeat domain-containing protein [Filimonas lacunae]BAV06140.1 inversin protein alternative isoform [Filimonas lacunae]SIT24848.1 Ankyrin repeat [Filimonas lacunae]